MQNKRKRMFILDAMALAFRNYHAFSRNPLRTDSGFPVSAIFGTAQFLNKTILEEKPDYFVVACDSPDKTFRHEIYSDYKANRSEMPEDLAKQLPGIFKLFEAFNMPMIRTPGFEADDILGSLVNQFSGPDLDCYIVSGDKDFMQLINPHVFLYSQKKRGEIAIVNEKEVFEKFSCKPNQVIDVLALIGDSSDNVPGVPGIGEKGAASLISKYENLDKIYENLDEITNKRQKNSLTENKELAYLSKELVTIKTDMDLDFKLENHDFNVERSVANESLLALYEEYGFRQLTQMTQAKLNQLEGNATDGAKQEEKKSPLQYRLIDTNQELKDYLALASKKEKVAFDTETTGLNICTDKPIGISFSHEPYQGVYIPLVAKHAPKLDLATAIDDLRDFLENQDGPIKIAHNLKFDMQMLDNIGIHPKGQLGDTMIQAFLQDSTAPSFGLDPLSEQFIGINKIPTSQLIGKKGEKSMLDVPIEELTTYACEDADCCLRLYNIFDPMLINRNLKSLYEEIELPLVPILAKMEKTGIFLDGDELAQFSDKLAKKVSELEEVIFEEAGEKFNINSTKQLQYILFEKLKIHEKLEIKRLKKTKTGYSTDMSVLQQLSSHPLPAAILEYRTVAKLKNTYVDTLPQLIEPTTSRVHTSFHQTGTATGRLSSSGPNLQNIPIRSSLGKEIRRAFCAENNQNKLISADYSQVELRILAHLAEDKGLKEAFESGKDIHTATAAKMFKLKLDEVTPDIRSRAKAINYGLIYGMGPQRLARETKVTVKEAKSFIESYFESFPNIKTYIDSAVKNASEKGFSETMTGRRRPIEGLDESNGLAAANARNIAVNSPIQGSAADLIKLAMIKIEKRLEEENLQAKMLLQVHDELVFECPESEVEKVMQLVKDNMEHAMELNIPIVADIGYGTDWLEAH